MLEWHIESWCENVDVRLLSGVVGEHVEISLDKKLRAAGDGWNLVKSFRVLAQDQWGKRDRSA